MNIKLLYSDSQIPVKANPSDAAFDCFVHNIEILDDNKVKVGLGFAAEVPEGYMLCIVPRSSIGKTNWQLANSIGIVDCGYNKEIFVVFNTFVKEKYINNLVHFLQDDFCFKKGERCCQMFLLPVIPLNLTVVDSISGNRDGFGSTGK